MWEKTFVSLPLPLYLLLAPSNPTPLHQHRASPPSSRSEPTTQCFRNNILIVAHVALDHHVTATSRLYNTTRPLGLTIIATLQTLVLAPPFALLLVLTATKHLWSASIFDLDFHQHRQIYPQSPEEEEEWNGSIVLFLGQKNKQ